MSETFRTPEGFDLPKPLLLPDVRDFTDLFEVVREWDFATMSAISGVVPRPDLVPIPPRVDELNIGPFLSLNVDGVKRSLAIRATPLVVNALAEPSDTFTTIRHDGQISFELIEHKANGRVLVVANHNALARSQYVAYIDPANIPAPSTAPEAGTGREVPPINGFVRGYLAQAAAQARADGVDTETQDALDAIARLGINVPVTDSDPPAGTLVIKVNGEEMDHADSLPEARRLRDTVIYGGIGTEANTTIEPRSKVDTKRVGRTGVVWHSMTDTMASSIVIITIPGLGQAVEVTVEHDADATQAQITGTVHTALRFAEFTTNGKTFTAQDLTD